jgi:hypothetical protein
VTAPVDSPVDLLPAGSGSLARGVPDAAPGTLFVLTGRGGIRVAPRPAFPVFFGRNEPEVHVCVGEDDPRVSRRHGLLQYERDRWTLRNTGAVPIRLPGSQLLLSGHEEPLGAVYTPLFIRTEPGREHLVEIRVAGRTVLGASASPEDRTAAPPVWQLTDRERLALVSLGQRYLRHEGHPRPESWAGVAAELAELDPAAGWTPKRAEWVVVGVRKRLAESGVRGLTREEVGEPVGNALNHNLLLELLVSTTLVPPDLRLLDG